MGKHSDTPWTLFRYGTQKGVGAALMMARHNKREIQAELGADGHIDATKSKLNFCLLGLQNAAAVSARWHSIADTPAASGALQKNSVTVIEALFSLPAKLPRTRPNGEPFDAPAYFKACLEWVTQRFVGGLRSNIIGADVHLDEAHPHMHVLLAPFVGGRWCASEILGNRTRTKEHQASFNASVAVLHGLKGAPAMGKKDRERMGRAVVDALVAAGHPVTCGPLWPAFKELVQESPLRLAQEMGVKVEAPPTKRRSFTAIMTSKGKGPKREDRAPESWVAKSPSESQTEFPRERLGKVGHFEGFLSCVGNCLAPMVFAAPLVPEGAHQCLMQQEEFR